MTFRDDKALATKKRNIFIEMFKKGMLMKKRMMERGLTRAKAKCPYCDGHWQARLAGPRKHIHIMCDGCDVRMME